MFVSVWIWFIFIITIPSRNEIFIIYLLEYFRETSISQCRDKFSHELTLQKTFFL